jgi:hypothetical protein
MELSGSQWTKSLKDFDFVCTDVRFLLAAITGKSNWKLGINFSEFSIKIPRQFLTFAKIKKTDIEKLFKKTPNYCQMISKKSAILERGDIVSLQCLDESSMVLFL